MDFAKPILKIRTAKSDVRSTSVSSEVWHKKAEIYSGEHN